MSVKDIESLFNPSESQDNMEYTKGDTENPHWTKVYRYPLGFFAMSEMWRPLVYHIVFTKQ